MPKDTKPAAKSITKSDFIRKFSSTTGASEIVAKAKAANLKLTPSFVYAIRAMDKKRRGGKAKKSDGATSAAPSSASTSTRKSVNKSAFVRSLPAELSAADVVAKGKAEGIKLTAAQVYTVRANAKRAGGKAPKGKPGPKPGAKAAKAAAAGKPVGRPAKAAAASDAGSHDHHFVSLVLNIGLAKAEALLARVRDKISNGL